MSSSPNTQSQDTAIELVSLVDSLVHEVEEVQSGSPDLSTTSLVKNANLERHSQYLRYPSINNTQAVSQDSPTVNLVDDQRSSDALPQSYTNKLEPENTKPSSSTGNVKSVLSCWSKWKWEIANSAISIIALAATISTLFPHQNQPLPQWPFHISINALLSIYSVVLKGSATFTIQSCIGQHQWLWMRQKRPLADVMRYDSAGRGVWGSCQWLVSQRLQQPLTAVGALIAVLMVAVDPFFQALLQYTDCQQSLGEKATVARTNYFELKNYFDDDQEEVEDPTPDEWRRGFVLSALPVSAQLSLRAAASTHASSVQPYCPTGNCTFETFSTVGYCSTCEDTSGQLEFSNEVKSNDGKKVSYSCNSMLPTGLNISFNTDDEHPSLFQGLIRGSNAHHQVGWNWDYSDHQVSVSTVFEFIAGKNFWSAGVWSAAGRNPTTGDPITTDCSDTTRNPEKEWSCRGYGAAQCTIFPCIREYEVAVTAGVVSETMIRHTPFETPQNASSVRGWNEPIIFVNTSCLSPEEISNFTSEGYSMAQTWLRYNVPWNVTRFDPDDPQSIWYNTGSEYLASMDARGCIYMFGPYLDLTLQTFLDGIQLFDGIVAGAGTYCNQIDRCVNSLSGSIELQTLYNSGKVSFVSINQTFENIAAGFTNYMRQNGNANYSAPAEGVVWHHATCLNVHWPWIALPASLVALASLVLLPLTILFTARAEVPVWKAHPLPFILRGPFVDEDSLPDEHGHCNAHSLDSLESMVKEVRVRLDQTEGEVKLVAASEGFEGRVGRRRRRVRRSLSLDEYQMG